MVTPDPTQPGELALQWDWEGYSFLRDGDAYRITVRDAAGRVLAEGSRAVSYRKPDDDLECGGVDVRAEASL